jgi:hypothetical protein
VKWVSAKEKLPKDDQEVLVKSHRLVNLAVYNSNLKRFVLRNGDKYDDLENIMWLELMPPNPDRTS